MKTPDYPSTWREEPPPHEEIPEYIDGCALSDLVPAPSVAIAQADDGYELKCPYFDILGHDRTRIFVYQHEKRMVSAIGESAWSDSGLTAIAPLQWWEANFRNDRGFSKKAAINWVQRVANKRGVFDTSRVRGRGAWLDEGRIVYHFGEALIVEGVPTPLHQIKSNFLYEQCRHLPMPSDEALSDEAGKSIFAIAKEFPWVNPVSAVLLVGWAAIAPICGALVWRPHAWITGGPGSGKTTVMTEFVKVLMSGTAIFANGNSTEAGIRQELQSDALPILFDESEQANERAFQRIQNTIALARQASSESGAKTYKGTAHGAGVNFLIRSMFIFSSIQVGIEHDADRDRLTILALQERRARGNQTEDTWPATKEKLYLLGRDRELPAKLMRRALNLLPITLKNIEVFAAAAAKKFGSQREGDQFGTLLAGAWSLVSQRPVTAEEAQGILERYDWSVCLEHTQADDSARAVSALMGAPIHLPHGESATVYEVICRATNTDASVVKMSPKEAADLLRRHGMAVLYSDAEPNEMVLFVSNSSSEVPKLLAGTPFAADLKGHLLRHPGARRREGTVSLSGTNHRGVDLMLAPILASGVWKPPLPKSDQGDSDVPF